MAILTLSYSAQSSSAPTQSGWNDFNVAFEGSHIFTVNDFTTDTNPEYVGNTFYSTKIITLPSKGTLKLNAIDISAGDEILSSDIALGLFAYVAESDIAGYKDSNCTFLVADEDSLLYNNTANNLIFIAASDENQPPDLVGAITINLSNPETYTFTPENFTTETIPAYSDPENDEAFAIKITSVPFYGTFFYNGNELSLNELVTIEDINKGLLKYVTDEEQDGATLESITFSISDKGSYEFTSGGVITLDVEAYIGSAPVINNETDVYVSLNENYIFRRYDLITAAEYYDADGDTAEAIRFTSLPSQGEIQLDGNAVLVSQEITLDDIDSGLLIYYTVQDSLGEFEMNYQVKDSSGEWSSTSTNAQTITSGSVGISLNENSGAGQVVYTIVVKDNTGVVNYAIGGADAGLLTLTGNVVTLNVDPDFETKSSYSFDAIASDEAGDSTTKTITFLILDVDESTPIITSSNFGLNLDDFSGAGQTIYTITATDDVDVVSYAISGSDASLLSLDNSTGVVTLIADPDYNTKSSYSFDVTASDAAGNVSNSTTVTFSINDPIVYLLETYTNSVVAYSLEKLSANTTNVVRVRRDSDNSEQDFSADDITDGTLTTFVGSGDGFVTTMYDQSSNSNHGVQTNTSNQPKIVDSGSYLGYVDFTNGSISPSSQVDSFGANSKMNFVDVVNINYNTNTFRSLHSWGNSNLRTYTSGGRLYTPNVGNQSWSGIQDNVWSIMNFSTNLGGVLDDGIAQTIVARINGASMSADFSDNRDHWDISYRDFKTLGANTTSTAVDIHRRAWIIFNDDISDFNSLESDVNEIFSIY